MKLNPLNLKVGDYCTAYQKGIHRIIKLEKEEYTSGGKLYRHILVTLEAVLDSNMNPSRKRVSTCDLEFCEKVDPKEFLEKVQASHESQLANIRKYLV